MICAGPRSPTIVSWLSTTTSASRAQARSSNIRRQRRGSSHGQLTFTRSSTRYVVACSEADCAKWSWCSQQSGARRAIERSVADAQASIPELAANARRERTRSEMCIVYEAYPGGSGAASRAAIFAEIRLELALAPGGPARTVASRHCHSGGGSGCAKNFRFAGGRRSQARILVHTGESRVEANDRVSHSTRLCCSIERRRARANVCALESRSKSHARSKIGRT